MKPFRLKMEFEGRPVAKAEGNNVSDFDNIMEGLKDKFDGPKKGRRL